MHYITIGIIFFVISLVFNFIANKSSMKNKIYRLPIIISLIYLILSLYLQERDKAEFVLDITEFILTEFTKFVGVIWVICIIILIIKYIRNKLL